MCVGWVLLAVQVWKCAGGGERCVDLKTQKRARNQLQKREAEVTSTVQERSHANNARVLCLECQLKTEVCTAKPCLTEVLAQEERDEAEMQNRKVACLPHFRANTAAVVL